MSEAIRQKSFEELYEELCKLPDNVVGQILDGELVVTPRPAPQHARASSGLGANFLILLIPVKVALVAGGFWMSQRFT